MERWVKPGFAVIGREGCTDEGEGFIARLWCETSSRFGKVLLPLAKTDANGVPVGFWGAMTDMSRSFLPWEEGFTRGLYLAGVECREDAVPPEGWTRWDVPGFEYIRVKSDSPEVFPQTLRMLESEGLTLAGAVHDFTDPATGQGYMCFPIRKLD